MIDKTDSLVDHLDGRIYCHILIVARVYGYTNAGNETIM